MNPSRWHRVEELFNALLALPPEERRAFLDGACGAEAELRAEVESLMKEAEEQPGDFLSESAFSLATRLLCQDQSAKLIGHTFGAYKIIKLLGRGGMGEVFLAEDPRLERLVALKLLPTLIKAQSSVELSIVQEARAASGVSHPNVTHIYEIGEDEACHYIAMEYVEGDSLRALLARKSLSAGEAVDVALQIAGALAAAHSSGVIHRDIKPENVIVRKDGYAKVLDFGLAKLTGAGGVNKVKGRLTSALQETPGLIIGTVAYMSPEQVQGWETDERTDIWSLGVVLYEMLAGERPFSGDTPQETVAAILTTDPKPLAGDAEPMTSLARVVWKALAKNLDARYQTATDFAQDLNRIKQHLFVEEHISARAGPHPIFDSGFGRTLFSIERLLLPAHSSGVVPSRRPLISWAAKAALMGLTISTALLAGLYVRHSKDAPSPAFAPPPGRAVTEPARKAGSIVILPFSNETGDERFDYVAEGLMEDVSRNLSRSSTLLVIDRQSARRVAEQGADFDHVRRLLGVDLALRCRIEMQASGLVVSPNIVDLVTGEVVLLGSFTVGRENLIQLRELMAGVLTVSLQGLLGEDKALVFDRHPTEDVEAYRCYMEGVYFAEKRGVDNLKRSVVLLERATKLDPNFALAYAALGNSYNLLGTWLGQSPDFYEPKARRAILRALSIDDSLAEAHTALAKIKMDYDRDWEGSEVEFRRAIELSPGYALAHHWYGEVYLSAMGRLEESLAELRLARRLDPLSTGTITGIAWSYIGLHQYEKALEACDEAEDIDSTDPMKQDASIYENRAKALMKLGRFAEAVANAQRACEIDHTGNNCAKVAAIYGMSGDRDKALEVLRSMKSDPARYGGVSSYDLAIIYAALGEKDRAFDLLNSEIGSVSVDLLSIKIDPMLDSLRDAPRFAELERRYKFPRTYHTQ
jgi:serine/threonine-protein kinase